MSRPFLDVGDGAEIRVLEPSDAEQVFALVDRERDRLRRWMPWVDASTSVDASRAFIERERSTGGLDGLGMFDGGTYLGGIGIRVDELDRHGEIGYWIGSAWEGRGFVTRSCRGLIGHAFGELGLHRLTIRAAPENTRSRAIPERLGFRRECVMREAGRTDAQGFVDLVVYGLLDREWAGPS